MIWEIELNEMKDNKEFADKVAELFGQINKNNNTFEQACYRIFGITTSQADTLLKLSPKQALRMNELSEAVGVDTSTMTRMVDQLIEKGMVLRQADEKDRRIVRVGLTAPGKKMHTQLSDALTSYYMESLDDISEPEREIIIQVLTRLRDAVDKGLENCCNKYCKQQAENNKG
jgi:DNA-binding MarR family transcriptional regulator